MTAHELIADIFSRVQDCPGNERRISPDQLGLLRRLIDQDEEGGALKDGRDGGFAWTPMGRNKYVVTVWPTRGKYGIRVLTRLANIVPSEAGSLF